MTKPFQAKKVTKSFQITCDTTFPGKEDDKTFPDNVQRNLSREMGYKIIPDNVRRNLSGQRVRHKRKTWTKAYATVALLEP